MWVAGPEKTEPGWGPEKPDLARGKENQSRAGAGKTKDRPGSEKRHKEGAEGPKHRKAGLFHVKQPGKSLKNSDRQVVSPYTSKTPSRGGRQMVILPSTARNC